MTPLAPSSGGATNSNKRGDEMNIDELEKVPVLKAVEMMHSRRHRS